MSNNPGMNEEEFFKYLLQKTKDVFLNANMLKEPGMDQKSWNYSVCGTSIKKHKGIIFGLNWGGGAIDAQSNYPNDNDPNDNPDKYPFISRSLGYFKKYLGIASIKEVNYTNLCFFRSPKIQKLNSDFWKLSLPLFEEYVKYINPPWTLMLGVTGISMLKIEEKLKNIVPIDAKSKSRTVFGYSGILIDRFPLICIPHPQARISTEAREKIWNALSMKLTFNTSN